MTENEFKIHVLPLSKKVFSMAYRMLGSEETARDAVQQGMLKIWENKRSLTSYSNIKSYVFKVVRNTCLDEIKRKKPVSIENIPIAQIDNNATKELLDLDEASRIITKIIEKLPDNQREVITLRDIEGFEFDEISEVLNTDSAYIRVLLSRARKSVRNEFNKVYAYETNMFA